MKNLLVVLGVALMFSCQNEEFHTTETKKYSLSIAESKGYASDFKTTTSTKPLHIDAERIKLKDLVRTIFQSDTLKFKYANEEISDKAYVTTINFKNDSFSAKKSALDYILKTYNLNYNVKETPVISLKIVDTAKLYKHYAKNATNNKSKTYISKDSISLENVSLKKISEIISKKLDTLISSDNTNALIDYNFKYKNLKDLQNNFKTNLGLEFTESKKKQLIYFISQQ